MWIVMAGVPLCGFSLYGTFKSRKEAEAAGKLISVMQDGDAWFVTPLEEPDLAVATVEDPGPIKVSDPDGAGIYAGSVVWDGDLCNEWGFIGPFDSSKAARQFAIAKGFGRICVLPLWRPCTEDDVRRKREELVATA
jgi:hypothetical protein